MILLGFAVIAIYRSSFAVFEVGVCLSAALAVSAYLWPWAWIVPYRVWNKMSRHYGEFARLYLLAQCYIIVSAVGMAGPSREFARNAGSGSGWMTREPVSDVMHVEDTGDVNRNWIRAYALWVMRTGQPWRFALLPFFILLSTLDIDDRTNVPTKTYTLY
jgi:hypothetical protein